MMQWPGDLKELLKGEWREENGQLVIRMSIGETAVFELDDKGNPIAESMRSYHQLYPIRRRVEEESMRELLRRWMRKHAHEYKPGAWDYDKDGADLVEQTSKLLNEDPYEVK